MTIAVSRRRLALALAVVVTAAWLPALRGGFVWDDYHDLLRSERLHRLGAVVEVFRHHAMWSADQPETAVATYRPLALATLALDWAAWGARPAGFHATNIALHVLATLAVFLALAGLVGDGAAFVVALLCALHPADAEAVAWINGRSEMLALGLGALGVWAASRRRWGAMALLLYAALLGKETALVFAPVAVAVAWLDRARRDGGHDGARHDGAHDGSRSDGVPTLRRSWPPLAAAAFAVAAYAATRWLALGATAVPSTGRAAARALPAIWARATAAAFVPAHAAPVTLSTWLAALSPTARAGCAAAGGALVAALALLAARRRWLAAVGLGWWLGAVAPAAAVAALDYPWPGLARWLYVGLPGLGLALAVAARRLDRRAIAVVVAVAAVASVVGLQRHIATWRSDERLFSTMAAESPDDAWAWRALGMTRLGAGRYADAAACFHRAAAVDKTAEVHAAYALEAYAWTFLGRCDEAIAQFRAHPVTPALKTEDFDAAARACQLRTKTR